LTQREYITLRCALQTVATTTAQYRQLRPPTIERPGKMSEQARFADYDRVLAVAADIVGDGEKLSVEAIGRRTRRSPARVREVIEHLRRLNRFPWALEKEVQS
jgi:hypothetical protein